MKSLMLMRHAKSSWDDPSQTDHDRPLNPRGRRDAPKIACWISEQSFDPDCILSSSAARALETAELLHDTLKSDFEIQVAPSLYHASPEQILNCVRSLPIESERAILVAHNPGMGELVGMLGGTWGNYPTAAISVFQIEIDDWAELDRSSILKLVSSIVPRAISD